MDTVEKVAERCTGAKVKAILDNKRHPLYSIFAEQISYSNRRLISPHCRT